MVNIQACTCHPVFFSRLVKPSVFSPSMWSMNPIRLHFVSICFYMRSYEREHVMSCVASSEAIIFINVLQFVGVMPCYFHLWHCGPVDERKETNHMSVMQPSFKIWVRNTCNLGSTLTKKKAVGKEKPSAWFWNQSAHGWSSQSVMGGDWSCVLFEKVSSFQSFWCKTSTQQMSFPMGSDIHSCFCVS